MDLHRSIIGLAAAALLVPLGCQSSTSSGTEYVITAKRELRTTVGADIGTVHDTAVDVVENELLYTIDNQARDAREGIINARTARGHAVRIETFRHGEQLTQIEVYVGPLGDETAERDGSGTAAGSARRRPLRRPWSRPSPPRPTSRSGGAVSLNGPPASADTRP